MATKKMLTEDSAAVVYTTPTQAVAPPVEIMAATIQGLVPPLETMPPTVTVTNGDILGGTAIADKKSNAVGWYTSIAPTDTTQQRYLGCSAPVNNPGDPYPDTWSVYFNHVTGTAGAFSHEVKLSGGQIIQYHVKQQAGAAFRIMVNGKYLTPEHVVIGGASGSFASIKIDFGAPLTVPVVVTYEGVSHKFYGLNHQNATTVTKVPGPEPKKILFAADSYFGGSGQVTMLTSMVKTAGWLLGYRNVVNSGIGGSGYIATGVLGQPALGGRVANDIVAQAPDVVVVSMGHNDTGSSNAAIQAAANSAVQAIRDGLPSAKIVVTGPMFSTANAGVYAAMQTAIFAGVSSVSNVVTVDTTTAPWITAANAAKYISSDATHPIQIGHDYFGHRLAAAIATATAVTF